MLQNDINNKEQSVNPQGSKRSEMEFRPSETVKCDCEEDYPQTIARFSDFSQYKTKKRSLFYRKPHSSSFFSKKITISMTLLLLAGISGVVFLFGFGEIGAKGQAKNPVASDEFQAAPDSVPLAANGSQGLTAQMPGELVSFANPMITSNQEQNVLSTDLPGEFDSLPNFSMLSDSSRKEAAASEIENESLSAKSNSSQPLQTSAPPKQNISDIPNWNDLPQKVSEPVAASSAYPQTPFNSPVSNSGNNRNLPPLNLPVNNSNDLTQNRTIPSTGFPSDQNSPFSANHQQANISNNENQAFSNYPTNSGNANSVNNFDSGENDRSRRIAFNSYPQTNISAGLPSGGFQGYNQESKMRSSLPQSQQGNTPNFSTASQIPSRDFSSSPTNSQSQPIGLNDQFPTDQAPLGSSSGTWQMPVDNRNNPMNQNQVRPIRSQIPQSENGSLYQPAGYAPTTTETIRNSQFTGQPIPSEINAVQTGTDSGSATGSLTQNAQQTSRFQGYSIQPDRNPINYSSNMDLYDSNKTLH